MADGRLLIPTRFSMTKTFDRIRRSEGQTMVELALVLPVLVTMLFGIIQFGIIFNNYVTLTDATRAGARKAAVSRFESDPAGVAEDAVRDSAANLDEDGLEVAVAASPGWEHAGEVTVTATYPFEINLFGFPVTSGDLTSTTKERIE